MTPCCRQTFQFATSEQLLTDPSRHPNKVGFDEAGLKWGKPLVYWQHVACKRQCGQQFRRGPLLGHVTLDQRNDVWLVPTTLPPFSFRAGNHRSYKEIPQTAGSVPRTKEDRYSIKGGSTFDFPKEKRIPRFYSKKDESCEAWKLNCWPSAIQKI